MKIERKNETNESESKDKKRLNEGRKGGTWTKSWSIYGSRN